MPNLLIRMLMLIEWMERGISWPGGESAIVQEAHDRIRELEAKLAAAEARPAHSVAVEIGHLQCVRNNLQEALDDVDVALNWINTMLATLKEQGHE